MRLTMRWGARASAASLAALAPAPPERNLWRWIARHRDIAKKHARMVYVFADGSRMR